MDEGEREGHEREEDEEDEEIADRSNKDGIARTPEIPTLTVGRGVTRKACAA